MNGLLHVRLLGCGSEVVGSWVLVKEYDCLRINMPWRFEQT